MEAFFAILAGIAIYAAAAILILAVVCLLYLLIAAVVDLIRGKSKWSDLFHLGNFVDDYRRRNHL